MSAIHPSAIIEDGASIGENVEIGPYCCIGPDVVLGDGVVLKSHVVIDGRTRIGDGVRIFPFASIGQVPQDLKYGGEPAKLEVGANTVIREYATMHIGTEGGGMLTKIGENCLIMGAAHVAHDCLLGNNVILAQGALLGGHVVIDDYAILGGGAAVHQFVRIGAHAMIGGMSAVERDVIPYGSVTGERAVLAGINLIGMKRRGYGRDELHAVRNAWPKLFAGESATLQERVNKVADEYAGLEAIAEIIDFMRTDTTRAFCQPRSGD
jgi:UDP-N-acetylglucosamine acyltransferase